MRVAMTSFLILYLKVADLYGLPEYIIVTTIRQIIEDTAIKKLSMAHSIEKAIADTIEHKYRASSENYKTHINETLIIISYLPFP